MIERVKLAADALRGRVVAAGWNWRSGTRPGHLFDGSKFSGALIYPGAWGQDSEVLRERSRIAYWESTQARAMLGRLVDNVIGTGLTLEAAPLWPLIGDGSTDEERHALAREIELRFHLWASSKEPDAAGRMNLYELQAAEFLNRLRDGETLMVLRYSGDAARQSPLSIQFLLPEQIETPIDKAHELAAREAGRRIVDGIEIDAYGRELAVYLKDSEKRTYTRVPVSGPSGRRFVLHPVVSDTLGAVRGTPVLAPLIHELQKITDYTVAEIEAAVINAVLAVYVKPGPDAPASRALSGITRRGAQEADAAGASGASPATVSFDKPGVIVQTLKAGEDVQSFDTKRPNVNFGEFVRHITRSLSSSVGIPIEVLEESFNANYSASRASLLLFWTTVERYRDGTASQFLGPVYEAWFAEEVRAGRIRAQGFDGASPVIRRAWINASWLGVSKPSIDPLKEANAVDVRLAAGLSTREREALAYNGSDYTENVRRLRTENELLAQAGESLKENTEPSLNVRDSETDPDDDMDDSPGDPVRGGSND